MLRAADPAAVVPNILVIPPNLIARASAVRLALDKYAASIVECHGRASTRVPSAASVGVYQLPITMSC